MPGYRPEAASRGPSSVTSKRIIAPIGPDGPRDDCRIGYHPLGGVGRDVGLGLIHLALADRQSSTRRTPRLSLGSHNASTPSRNTSGASPCRCRRRTRLSKELSATNSCQGTHGPRSSTSGSFSTRRDANDALRSYSVHLLPGQLSGEVCFIDASSRSRKCRVWSGGCGRHRADLFP